ncbi:MAG: hypothetical protein HPY50_04245 [Firmicutes bacterium]|nr:hypothetical protein [Bacillota bacterium]
MKNQWLMAYNFERTNELITSINTISIHSKLLLNGFDDSERIPEVKKAETILINFLNQLEPIVSETEHDKNKTIVGIDPHLSMLANQFLTERDQLPPRSSLYNFSLKKLRLLLLSNQPDELHQLISCLRDLRALLEQVSQTDIEGIFGDQ